MEFLYKLLVIPKAMRIGDFRNVFKFHAYSVNKRLFLTTAKLVRGLSDVAQLMYAKWIPAIEITLKEVGESNGLALGLGRRISINLNTLRKSPIVLSETITKVFWDICIKLKFSGDPRKFNDIFMYIAPSSGSSLLILNLPCKLIQMRFDVVSWCLEWNCCTFQKINDNSFKSTKYYNCFIQCFNHKPAPYPDTEVGSCEPRWALYDDSCFYSPPNTLDWESAKTECRNMFPGRSDLASIRSYEEQSFISGGCICYNILPNK